MISATVKRTKTLSMGQFQKTLRKVNIGVGLVGLAAKDKHGDSSLSILEVGVIQEFGTDTIPARKWLSKSFRAQKDYVYRQYKKKLSASIKSNSLQTEKVSEEIATAVVQRVQAYMTAGPHLTPALAESTVHKKQKTSTQPTRPVFEKGILAAAISWRKL